MRFAMIGTRGVPAAYGGFETAVEEIGARLVDRGHEVTVYCRNADDAAPEWRGMRLVHLPALHLKTAETLSHTAASTLHLTFARTADVAFVFNAANAPLVPWIRALGIPTAVHVDGLEWKREKWSGAGRRYYRFAERFAVRHADALIADARGIADYYRDEFDVATELLTYGAPITVNPRSHRLAELGLEPQGFHLVVARFEPENHVDVIVEGYRRSGASLPLIVVGSAPYAAKHSAEIRGAADDDPRIRFLGSLWDQELLDQLYSNAFTYLHGHSVGGTNPSLLRAMGGAAPVIAWDVIFNEEVAGPDAGFFSTPLGLARMIERAESDPAAHAARGERLQRRARATYDWDDVAAGYESLGERLHAGESIRRPHPSLTTAPREQRLS
jgi:glycosyltransferase involved in cell wall biosynthesis